MNYNKKDNPLLGLWILLSAGYGKLELVDWLQSGDKIPYVILKTNSVFVYISKIKLKIVKCKEMVDRKVNLVYFA